MSFLIRLVEKNDLKKMMELVNQIGVGITTLPKNKNYMKDKILHSIKSIKKHIDYPEDESYFFVMEDLKEKKIIGCCGIVAAVGASTPFYSYKISTIVQKSIELHIDQETQVLSLVNDYQGTTELCSLYLLPDYRHHALGKFLSRSRFLFMANFPHRFAKRVIVEFRGICDPEGNSPFWKNIGQHFFGISFSEADYLSGIDKKQFIADLMPKSPVYINLLPQEAQEVIAKTHPRTEPAKQFLKDEGFQYQHYVDIFDGGPTMEAFFQEIHSIKKSILIEVAEIVESIPSTPRLISNDRLAFRAVIGTIKINDDKATIDRESADQLKIQVGDTVRILP